MEENKLEVSDAELLDGVDLSGSPASSDDTTPSAASYHSRPQSRASSTEELRGSIERLEREAGERAELRPVPEGAELELEQEQRHRQQQQQHMQNSAQQEEKGGGGAPTAASGLTQYMGQAGISESESESEEGRMLQQAATEIGGQPAGEKENPKRSARTPRRTFQ